MESFKRRNNGEMLFDEELVIRIAENGDPLSTASARSLRLLIQLQERTSSSKELLVRLTDDQDPFTLYSCIVREEDYQSLKQHQGLLIDFTVFPHKFVELVNTCIRENQTDSPRFLLVLRTNENNSGSSSLEVVEVNIFKHLCHLALTLAPAPTQLKLTYLADCCRALKAEVVSRGREAEETENQLKQQIRHMQDIIAKSSAELQHLRVKLDQETALSSERQVQLMKQEKDKLLKLQSDADRKADRERRDFEARMNHRTEQLQAKITSLSNQNSELSEKRHKAESYVKELKGRLGNAEGELERCRQELSHTKRHNTQLDHDYQTSSKLSRELGAHKAHLEAELNTKESTLTRTLQSLESLQQQKVTLEEALEEKKQKLTKRENSIQLLYSELQKSLDIIKKLQKRMGEEHMRSKVRGAALAESDKVVGEKESKVTALNDQLQEVMTRLSQLTLDNEKLQTELRASQEKLQEQDKTLKNNENVIAWLNKQLNEAEIGGAILKRAPLTEAYMTSQGLPSLGPTSGHHGVLSHSTPLSNTLRSFPTVTSGWSGGMHTLGSSVRNLGNIPPIPEEISPRATDSSPPYKDASPPNKENFEGLDPKFLRPTNPSVVPVQGLLRANYQRTSQQDVNSERNQLGDKKKDESKGRGSTSGRGVRKSTANTSKKPGVVSQKKTSSYFPRS